jgi:hypothetical protein
MKEKHVYEDWRAHTQWGQLFQRYQENGYLSSIPLGEMNG